MKSSKGFTLIEMIIVMAVFFFIIGAAISIFISIIANQRKVLAEQQFMSQISYVEEHISKALRMATTDPTGDCLKYVDPTTGDKTGQNPNPNYIYLLTRKNGYSVYQGIEFINHSNGDKCQEFFLDNTDGVLKEKDWDSAAQAIALTPPSLKFYKTNPIRFSINGGDGSLSGQQTCGGLTAQCGFKANTFEDPNSQIQPRITMLLNVLIPESGSNEAKSCKILGDADCDVGYGCDGVLCQPIRTIQTTISQRNLNTQQ